MQAFKLCWILTHIQIGLKRQWQYWKAKIPAEILIPVWFGRKNKTFLLFVSKVTQNLCSDTDFAASVREKFTVSVRITSFSVLFLAVWRGDFYGVTFALVPCTILRACFVIHKSLVFNVRLNRVLILHYSLHRQATEHVELVRRVELKWK